MQRLLPSPFVLALRPTTLSPRGPVCRRVHVVVLPQICVIRDRCTGSLWPVVIFLSEVHTNSMLRYDYKQFSAALGERVKQLRKERGLTLRALVVEHDFHLTQIQRIEQGNGISVPTLLRVAEVF